MVAEGSKRWWMAAVAAVLAVASSAPAGVVNGDFDTPPGLTGWFPAVVGDDSYVVAEPSLISPPMLAHLHAQATYTWDGAQWVGDLQSAGLFQLGASVEEGKSTILFSASAYISGLENTWPQFTASPLGYMPAAQTFAAPAWTTYRLDLVDALGDPLPAGTWVDLTLVVNASAPISDGGQVGQQVDQVLDVYLDDVKLCPLPAPAAILLAGCLALRRRRG